MKKKTIEDMAFRQEIEIGNKILSSGNVSKAIETFHKLKQKAVAEEKRVEVFSIQSSLIRAFYLSGDMENAKNEIYNFKENVKNTPQPERAYFYNELAVIYQQVGDVENAARSFINSIEINRKYKENQNAVAVCVNLLNLYKQSGRLGELVSLINNLKEDLETTDDAKIKRLIMRIYIEFWMSVFKDPQKVKELCYNLELMGRTKNIPEDILYGLYWKAKINLIEGNIDEVIEASGEIAKAGRFGSNLHYVYMARHLLSQAYLVKGLKDIAVFLANENIKASNNSPASLLHAGKIHLGAQNLMESLNIYNQILEVSINEGNLLNEISSRIGLARLYLLENKKDEATQEIKKVIELIHYISGDLPEKEQLQLWLDGDIDTIKELLRI